jgi:hypothetical protein
MSQGAWHWIFGILALLLVLVKPWENIFIGFIIGILECEIVKPLVLQVYIRDHTGSLDTPNMDTNSDIMNYHSDFLIGSTFRICSPIDYIAVTLPLNQETNDSNQAKCKEDVYHS